ATKPAIAKLADTINFFITPLQIKLVVWRQSPAQVKSLPDWPMEPRCIMTGQARQSTLRSTGILAGDFTQAMHWSSSHLSIVSRASCGLAHGSARAFSAPDTTKAPCGALVVSGGESGICSARP